MEDRRLFAALLAVIFAIIGICLLNSCKTVQTVVEYRDHFVHDTTEVVDSVYIDQVHYIQQKGDTVFKTDSVYVYKYRTLDKVVIEEVHDSIPYPVEVIKEVKYTSSFAKFCEGFFILLLIILLGLVGWRIYRKFFLHV